MNKYEPIFKYEGRLEAGNLYKSIKNMILDGTIDEEDAVECREDDSIDIGNINIETEPFIIYKKEHNE